MFGDNKVQVQVQSNSGLFADATKLKPRSMTLEIIKGVIFGGLGIGAVGAGTKGGFELLSGADEEDVGKAALRGGVFGVVTGALVGAFWQFQRTKVHNNWVDTMAARMNVPTDHNLSYQQREDQRVASKETSQQSGVTMLQ